MKTIELLNLPKTQYGQIDLTQSGVRKILEENGYSTSAPKSDRGYIEYEETGCEGFDGFNDSSIGRTANAKNATPIILPIYKKTVMKALPSEQELLKEEFDNLSDHQKNLTLLRKGVKTEQEIFQEYLTNKIREYQSIPDLTKEQILEKAEYSANYNVTKKIPMILGKKSFFAKFDDLEI